jgi:membrane-bound serine protease (ClpP class)
MQRVSSGTRRSLALRAAAACVFAAFAVVAIVAQSPTPPVVYVIPVEGTIDLGLAPFLSRTLLEAEAAGAAAVLLEINTFGGRVDAAVVMRDALLDARIRTIAFVNQRAISAGALIALACDTLVMARAGSIGAAAPVLGGAGETQPADEKTVSYVRTEFRATAEARNRPPEFAEAMVDADVEIEGVIGRGKLLTLTTSEALDYDVADLTADTVHGALEAAGLADADLRNSRQTWAETLVRFLTSSVVSSLLMSVGLLGLLVEIRTPGFAVPGAIGVVSLGLFFWGHWIVRLAGWEELLLVSLGVLLLGLEVFVLPGITFAGAAGVLALVAGLGMSLVGAGATPSVMITVLGRVAMSILVAMAAAFALFRALPHLPFGRRLVLGAGMPSGSGESIGPDGGRSWVGRTGTALSPLRPAGIGEIDGSRVDVVSDGEFIDARTRFEVTRVDGNRIVVRRLASPGEPTDGKS